MECSARREEVVMLGTQIVACLGAWRGLISDLIGRVNGGGMWSYRFLVNTLDLARLGVVVCH